jgi:hypothetical protein
MNNLRTVARLGVDKFTSHSAAESGLRSACKLANTLRPEEEEYLYIAKSKKPN